MRLHYYFLYGAFVWSTCLPAQEWLPQMPVEDSICHCIEQSFAADSVALAVVFRRWEADLVQRSYLSNPGAGYPALFVQIAEAAYFQLRRSPGLPKDLALRFSTYLTDCYSRWLLLESEALLQARITSIILSYQNVYGADFQALQSSLLQIYLQNLEPADFRRKLYQWLALWNLLALSVEDVRPDLPYPEDTLTLPTERLLPVQVSGQDQLQVRDTITSFEAFKVLLINQFRQGNGVCLSRAADANDAFYQGVYQFIRATHHELLDEAAARFDKVYAHLTAIDAYRLRQEFPLIIVEK